MASQIKKKRHFLPFSGTRSVLNVSELFLSAVKFSVALLTEDARAERAPAIRFNLFENGKAESNFALT